VGGCVVIVCLLAAAAAQLILKHIFVRFRNKFSSITLSLSFLGPLWSGQDVRGVSKLTNLEIVFLRNRQMMNRNPEKPKKKEKKNM